MMRGIKQLVVTVSGLVALGLNATGQETGWYAKLDVGPNFVQDADLKSFPGVFGKRTVEFDPGVRFAVGGGYKFFEWLGVEVDTGVAANEIDRISGNSSVDAGVVNVPVMANVISECRRCGPWVPFIGGGVGVSSTILDVDHIRVDDVTVFEGSESDAVFAWQGFAGVRYELNDRWSVGLAYRYLGTDAPSWDVHEIFTGREDHIRLGTLNNHAVTFGFVYRF